MKKQKTERITKETEALLSCVIAVLDYHKINFEFKEEDLSHAKSIWYQIIIKTRPGSGLKLVLHLFRDAIGIICNDYQIFIYQSEKPSDFEKWMEYFPKVISAIFCPEIRIRGRHSFSSGKTAAIWLELPEGGMWLGDKKACQGSGKEYIFRNWF